MALQPEELYGPEVAQTPSLRAFPAENGVAVGTFEAVAADEEIPNLTPLVRTGTGAAATWAVWQDADTEIGALLWAPDQPHQALLAGETLAQLFKSGVVHADDIPLPAGQTLGLLQGILESQEMRNQGIVVQGLPGVA